MVSEKQILELKRKAGELRDRSIQAKATLVEVENNIKSYELKLKELGIKSIESVNDEIACMEKEIQEIYNEAVEKLSKWI